MVMPISAANIAVNSSILPPMMTSSMATLSSRGLSMSSPMLSKDEAGSHDEIPFELV